MSDEQDEQGSAQEWSKPGKVEPFQRRLSDQERADAHKALIKRALEDLVHRMEAARRDAVLVSKITMARGRQL